MAVALVEHREQQRVGRFRNLLWFRHHPVFLHRRETLPDPALAGPFVFALRLTCAECEQRALLFMFSEENINSRSRDSCFYREALTRR